VKDEKERMEREREGLSVVLGEMTLTEDQQTLVYYHEI